MANPEIKKSVEEVPKKKFSYDYEGMNLSFIISVADSKDLDAIKHITAIFFKDAEKEINKNKQ